MAGSNAAHDAIPGTSRELEEAEGQIAVSEQSQDSELNDSNGLEQALEIVRFRLDETEITMKSFEDRSNVMDHEMEELKTILQGIQNEVVRSPATALTVLASEIGISASV
jgi:chromosome segregation ATPase